MNSKRIGLAAKRWAYCISSTLSLLVSTSVLAGIPVIDGTNVAQSTISAIQNVAAVQQQIQQYRTQLQQYENMLSNTASLPNQTWSQVQGTIQGLSQAMQGLQNMTNGAGSIQSYLDKFGNTNAYASQPCFSGGSCTSSDVTKIVSNNAAGNASIKVATDSQLKALQQQQESLNTDATTVQQLQSSALGAQGQKSAIDAANQLAVAQANQLVQIRALLVAQQTAQAAKMEQDNAIQAQQQASHNHLFQMGTTSDYTTSQTFSAAH